MKYDTRIYLAAVIVGLLVLGTFLWSMSGQNKTAGTYTIVSGCVDHEPKITCNNGEITMYAGAPAQKIAAISEENLGKTLNVYIKLSDKINLNNACVRKFQTKGAWNQINYYIVGPDGAKVLLWTVDATNCTVSR